jgi:iron complex outermembrane receptor protein
MTYSKCNLQKMKATSALLAIAVGTAYAGSAFSQTNSTPTNDSPGVAPPTESGEILVTAQRRSERLRDVPITMIAQTGADLARANVTGMRDLAIAVPGLALVGSGPYLQPVIRGVTTQIVGVGTESPIAIYLDGVYLPSQVNSAFDLPDVERIEVLKGPQGTLFGRNATGGAIVIHTLEPSFHTGGTASVSAGIYAGSGARSAGDYTAKGTLNVPIVDDKIAASISGYYNHIGSYLTDDRSGGKTGRVNSYAVRGKVLIKPTDNLKILFSAYYNNKKDSIDAATAAYRNVTVATQFPDAIVPQKPWHVASEIAGSTAFVNTVGKGASIKADLEIGDAGTLTSLTAYSYSNAFVEAEVDGSYSPKCVATFTCITPYEFGYGPSRTWQQEVTFASKKFGIFRLTTGAFYYHDNSDFNAQVNTPLDSQGHATGPAPFFDAANAKTTAYAGFGEMNADVTDRLHLIAGLRYSWERKVGSGSILGSSTFDLGGRPSWGSWTPRLSIRYDVSRSLNVYATYSKGFKSGVINTVAVSNDVAAPETLNSYEVGMKYGDRLLNFSASAYYYDYKNLQQEFLQGITTVIGNAAASRMYGVDFDGSIKLSEGLHLRAGGSWLPYAKYKSYLSGIGYALPVTAAGLAQVDVDASGHRMLRTPRFTGNASISYETKLNSGKFDASMNVYTSSSYGWELLNRVRTNGYVTLGAQAGWTPDSLPVRFSVWAKNLTNEKHIATTTLSAEADLVVYTPPRVIGLSADCKF